MPYSRVANHGSMLFDANRNELYAQAIHSAVRPGSVVLDLGAGLGIHGLLAAAAGASRVYLVEPQPVVHAAMEVARANGFSGSVVILQDKIENVCLPEPVDLIVSVFTGNLLFSEDLLPSLFYARDRYLKPTGQLLPDRAELRLAPICAPDLHQRHVARWSEPVMGLDYSSARTFAANEILWLRSEDFRGSKRLGDGVLISQVDLSSATSADCKGEATCTVTAGGECHGLLAWIRIRLGEQWMSTDPDSPEVHWFPVMLPLDPPLSLTQDETLKLTLQRPAYGDWTWSAAAGAGTRRHSSFLGTAGGARELRRRAPATRPGLGADGATALQILTLLRDGMCNGDIARKISEDHGMSGAKALRQVQAFALRFGKPE